MTDVALGRLLRKYGVSSRTIWLGEECAKGYLREDLVKVCRRYVTKADMTLLKEECVERPRTNWNDEGTDVNREQGRIRDAGGF